ncbi:MAG TPA: aspartate aminotransferase family protein [Clostridia bacterium]|nr:aspartate aminotransferase family protein [Clostridia bacterium]HPQ47438.1 aspartate aminotransferase family protein [Clostridia bacterium]HRX42659.1 aspartate aminotransferase family protein [Clostridia bacterium]
MAKSFKMESVEVEKVETPNRRICTSIPAPGSLPVVEKLRKYEPVSMSGQPLVVWDRAEGFNVYDKYGNKWIDFSSGVLVTNAGHANPEIKRAAMSMIEHGLLHNYCFPTEIRSELVEKLVEISPAPLEKVFLLTTGSEACECAIKLARTYGRKKGGDGKIKIITFIDDFHGRTMGSQMAGGSPAAKEWIVNIDPDMNQVPFPNSFYYEWADESRDDYSDDKCFDTWMGYLDEQGIKPEQIAAFMPETFQGGWAQFMPVGFVQRLRRFCDDNDILLIFDEVQAGFGRSGKLYSYQHYEVKADLVCLGKGVSSSLPLSGVIGRKDLLDLYGPNKMTSTHTGNPVCCAAALANIDYIIGNRLIEKSEELGYILEEKLDEIVGKYPEYIGNNKGKGLVRALVITKKNSREIDPDLAHDIVRISIEKGLLFFAPVGAGSTIKICPPLVITKEALLEGLSVLDEAIGLAVAQA